MGCTVVLLLGVAPLSAQPDPLPPPTTWRTRLVGHLDLRQEGFAADVWGHRDTAYIGGWGTGNTCPGHGVRAIDINRPGEPQLVSSFAGRADFPATTSEDVWVGYVRTPNFTGDLAAVGIQLCGRASPTTFRGLALYDVTDPANPRLLGTSHSGAGTRGVHELSVARRNDGRVLALGSVPGSLRATGGAAGDVRIIDITDPANPVEVADWDFSRDAPPAVREPVVRTRGGGGQLRAHSVWPGKRGMQAVVSHWDAGAVFLDIADPAVPMFIGHTTYSPGDDGNAHSGWFTADERYWILNDETGPVDWWADSRQPYWGYQRIISLEDPTRPYQVAEFMTANARARALDGVYSVHNNVVRGPLQYVSWFSDGVRLVSVADVTRPREIAAFIPPPVADPHGHWVAPDGTREMPIVWGVYPHRDMVLASDVNSGLWIFRLDLGGLARPH